MTSQLNNGYTLRLPERPQGLKPIRHKQTQVGKPVRSKLNLTVPIVGLMLTVLLLKGCLQNGALQAQLDESLAKLSKVQESLKATENERDESRVELSLSEAELKSQRMAAESVNGSQTELKQLHLGRLIQFADFVADNPAMTRRVLQEADAFAKKWALDDRPIKERLNRLSNIKKLPIGTSLSVVGREDY